MNGSEKKIIVIVSMGIMAMLAFSYYWYAATEQETGRVDHKSLCGIMNDTSITLVTFTSNGLNVNPLVHDLFIDEDTNLTITSEIEQELENRGFDVYYIGNIVLTSSDNMNGIGSGEAFGYFIDSRDDFNHLIPGNNVLFSVPHDEEFTIQNVKIKD